MRALAVLLLLAACAATPSYRNASAPIASAATFESARFAGTWHEVATYPGPDACLGATESWAPRGDGTFAVQRGCRGTWSVGTATVTGPGRFTLSMPDAEPEPVWILWIDQDYRTAVIGQPAGEMGRVLNREPQIPADRMTAAREILAFNGYDPARLQGGPPPASDASPSRLAQAASLAPAAAVAVAGTAIPGGTLGAAAVQGAVTAGSRMLR